MFKIRLSILLLTSFLVISCTNSQINTSDQKYSLDYIGGGFDGLLLKNYLISSLRNIDFYDPQSNFKIKANISHSSNLFITNIDNTSDREKISTNLSVEIINILTECRIMNEEINISQFYIYASSDKFLSNQIALKEIKKNHTESLVKSFINKLLTTNNKCDE